MITEWILFLAGNLLICGGFVLLGKSIEHNPAGDRTAALAYRSKKLPDTDAAWNASQKLFGSVLVKGGYALMIINIIIMLCVLNAKPVILNTAGLLLLVLNLFYYFAARLYTQNQIASRFDHEPAPAPAQTEPAEDEPAKEAEEETVPSEPAADAENPVSEEPVETSESETASLPADTPADPEPVSADEEKTETVPEENKDDSAASAESVQESEPAAMEELDESDAKISTKRYKHMRRSDKHQS